VAAALNSVLSLDRRFEALDETARTSVVRAQTELGEIASTFEKGVNEALQRQSRTIHKISENVDALADGVFRSRTATERISENIDALADGVFRSRTATERISENIDALADGVFQSRTATESLSAKVAGIEAYQSVLGRQLELNSTTASNELKSGVALLSGKLDDYTGKLSADISSLERPMAIPLGDNLLLTRVRQFFYFVPAEDVQLASYLALGGHLETGVAELLEKIVRRGMTVVDIGANIGLHALSCASLVGCEGRAYCFEPVPRLAKILEMNLVLNQLRDRAVIEQVALTDQPGTAAFHFKAICGHSSLYDDGKEAQLLNVRTAPLDSMLPDGIRVDLVKIDAEGAEPVILRGMSQTIARNPEIIIILEFAPPLLQRANCSPRNFLRELRAMKFDMLRIDDASGELHAVGDDEIYAAASMNLLLRKPSRGSPVA
jgi:FkbM family methyltransferase